MPAAYVPEEEAGAGRGAVGARLGDGAVALGQPAGVDPNLLLLPLLHFLLLPLGRLLPLPLGLLHLLLLLLH